VLRLLADQSRCRRTAIRRRHQATKASASGVLMICLLQQRYQHIYGLAILNKETEFISNFFFGNAKSALWSPDGGRQWPNDGEEEGPLCCVRWRWKGGGRGETERRFSGVPRQGLATSQSLAPLVCCCVIPHFVLAPSSICSEPKSGRLTRSTW